MKKKVIFPGGRKSMEINATRNNYITNLSSTYDGVKCRRLATLRQKDLKALPRSIDYDWLQLNQNLYTEAPFHVQIFSLLIFAFLFLVSLNKTSRQNSLFAVFRNFWFANGQEIQYIIFINNKISVEVNVVRYFC